MGVDGELMLSGLLRGDHLTSLEDMPGLVADHTRPLGFSGSVLYVGDLQQQFLVPLPGQRDAAGRPLEPLRIDATMAGRAFREVKVVRLPATAEPAAGEPAPPPAGEGRLRLWVPLLDGTERIGVLGLTAPGYDETTERRVKTLASLLALQLASKRQSSDTYARLVRAQPMTLSAEVLWTLMPVRAFANDRVVVCGALEPAYLVGGDAFDYALAGETLHLAIFDAMGHDTSAGLTTTIAMGSYRNNRRQGTDLFAAGEAIDEAIAEQFRQTRFVTGILAGLDIATGSLTWVNRGHHPPLVLREGQVAAMLDTPPDPPMGFRLGAAVPASRYQLEPGDRLLFYTDGIIEAQSPGGEHFGLDRFIDFIVRHESDGVPAPETLRRLINTILAHQNGRLQDDATVLLVEWLTGQAELTL